MRGESATCRRRAFFLPRVSDPAMVIDHQYLRAERQVEDLPRIGVAEPLARKPLDHPLTRMVLTPCETRQSLN